MIQASTKIKLPYGKLKYVHRDKNHNIILSHEQPIDSHIQQFWQRHIHGLMSGERYDYINLSGSGNSGAYHQTRQALMQANGVRGIVVGTGSGAVTYGNVNLDSRIIFGNSSNQLAADDGSLSYDDATGIGTVSRTFTNNNAVTSPTVAECGIAFANVPNTASNTFLGVRDILSIPVTLALDDTLTITYQIDFQEGTVNWKRLMVYNYHSRPDSNASYYNNTGSVFTGTTTTEEVNPCFFALYGNHDRGITLGSSSANSTEYNVYALESKIYNGTGSGQLVYYDSRADAQNFINTVNNDYTTWTVRRLFKNLGSSNVVISEIGLESNVTAGTTNQYVLFNRQVLASSIELAPNQTIMASWQVKYEF